ncbi:hypothetical protein N7448_011056 [Penicillium atrosanguineum]|nr:hypothetical protein N7448_011056 [Penicillium atrosanguineum]
MRIADVGTGTGIWLRDVADILPVTCQLDGFDISDAMFPSKTVLPANVTFRRQNLLEKFPDDYLGKYDVVNVRVMVVALSFDEWEPAVRNLMTLLRGYLQWVDCAAHEALVKGAANGKPPFNAEHYLELFRLIANVFGKTPKVAALHSIFQKSRLEACEEYIYPLINPDSLEDVNAAVIDGIQNILTAALEIRELDWVRSKDQILKLKEAALRDLHNHQCWYCYDVYVVIGRNSQG